MIYEKLFSENNLGEHRFASGIALWLTAKINDAKLLIANPELCEIATDPDGDWAELNAIKTHFQSLTTVNKVEYLLDIPHIIILAVETEEMPKWLFLQMLGIGA